MARKKRSEGVAGAVAAKPAPAPPAVKVATRILVAKCPVCAKSIVENRAVKVGNIAIDKIGYFESIPWREDYPFGISFSAAGRGSLRDWEYINPEDAPELFEAVKARFLQAIREWIKKGWITEEDIG